MRSRGGKRRELNSRLAALGGNDGNCGIQVEPLRMGKISAGVALEGEDIPSRGGALLESRSVEEEPWGKGKTDAPEVFSSC